MPTVQVADQADLVTVLPAAVFLVTSTRRWHATLLGSHLAGRLTGFPGTDLADLVAGSINALTREHALTPGTAPASAVGILRWNAESVDAYVLGDTPVTVFADRGAQPLSQPGRLAEADPDIAYEARQARWPRPAVHAAMLADGHVPSWPDALEQASARGPEAVLDDLTALAVVTF